MNIQPVQNYNISMQGKNNWWKRTKNNVVQKILDITPSYTAKDTPRLNDKRNKIDNLISRPDVNRGIMGATAIITQPAIDYYNHRVDEETRTVARNRTIAKIVAGTGVGIFCVRGPIYKAIENMTDIKGKSRFSKSLLPKEFMDKIIKNENSLKTYRSSLAMFLALLTMCYTNFALDAPLTVFFTNLLNEKTLGKEKKND